MAGSVAPKKVHNTGENVVVDVTEIANSCLKKRLLLFFFPPRAVGRTASRPVNVYDDDSEGEGGRGGGSSFSFSSIQGRFDGKDVDTVWGFPDMIQDDADASSTTTSTTRQGSIGAKK